MAMAAASKAGAAPLELTITRVIDAPRALVRKTWTDPEHAKHRGRCGFTVNYVTQEMRAGGA